MWKMIVLLVFTLSFLEECYGKIPERRLVDFLMQDHDPNVRPAQSVDDIIMVNFSIAIQQIIDLDEKNQLLTTSLYMTWAWRDVQLVWNSSDFNNIDSIRLPAKMVWKPDIFVYNSAADSFDQMLHTNVIIFSDGKVEWLPPGIFKTTCAVDIQNFPFDEQKCSIKFGAWSHHGNLIDFYLLGGGLADDSAYYESGEWDYVSMTGIRNSQRYGCCDHPFIDATFTIHMKRKSNFYIFNLILPCVLVCSLTILIFVLPADSGERMTLGITVLLAMVVFLQIVADNLPPTETVPLMGKYFICSVVMVTLSVVISIFSMNLHYTTSATSERMPVWIELIFLQVLPKALFMKMPDNNGTQKDPILKMNDEESVPLVDRVGHRLGSWHNELHENKDPSTRVAMQLRHTEKQISKMCGDLHDIVQKMRDDGNDDEIAAKWRFAARVMDRFCLIFFVVFFVLSTVFTIGMPPIPEQTTKSTILADSYSASNSTTLPDLNSTYS